MNTEKDLLIGVLAVQWGKASPQQVMAAAAAWAADRSSGLAERLVANDVLSCDARALLERIASEAITAHDGDVAETLRTIGGERLAYQSIRGVIQVKTGGDVSALTTDDAEEDRLAVTPETPGRYSFGERGEDETPKTSSEIGRGGIGRVLMVHDRHLGRYVAVKELLSEHAELMSERETPGSGSSVLAARFLREARITGQLEHPNIVPVYEIGVRDDGRLYYTMKLVRGRTLASALNACRTLDERLRLLKHYIDLCNAIAYAHDRGVIHRDIKPENVMVGEFGETVVLDWGLARVQGKEDLQGRQLERQIRLHMDEQAGRTMEGRAIGTPAYMSPEHAEGQIDKIDELSDVWSLGAVLYKILTSRPPFVDVDSDDLISRAMSEPAEPVLAVCPDAPAELAAIADKALQYERVDRYRSAKAIAEEVEAYQEGRRVKAYEYGSLELLKRFVVKNRALSFSVVAAVLVLLAATALILQAYAEKVEAQRRTLVALASAETNEAEAKDAAARAKEEEARARIAEAEATSSAAETSRARIEAVRQRDDARSLADLLLYDLNDDVEALEGSSSARKKMVSAALDYYRKQTDPDATSMKERRELAMAYRLSGELAATDGQMSEARRFLEEAIAIDSELLERGMAEDGKGSVSDSYVMLGDVARTEKRYAEARYLYKRGLSVRQGLCKQNPGADERLRDLLVSYAKLGRLALDEQKHDEAYAYYYCSLTLAVALVMIHPDDDKTILDLSGVYHELGRIAEAEQRIDVASEFHNRAFKLRAFLAARAPEDVGIQRKLSSSYNMLAGIAFDKGQIKRASKYYEAGLSIRKMLVAQAPQSEAALHALFVSHWFVGVATKEEGRLEYARSSLTEGLQIAVRLAELKPEEKSLPGVVYFFHLKLGEIAFAQGRLQEAHRNYEDGRTLLLGVIRAGSREQKYMQYLVRVTGRLAELAESQGKVDQAYAYFTDLLLEQQKNCKSRSDGLFSSIALVSTHKKMAELAASQEKTGVATEHYLDASDILKKLVVAEPDNTYLLQDLSDTIVRLGHTVLLVGQRDKAHSHFERAIAIASSASEDAPDDKSRLRNLAITHERIGSMVKDTDAVDYARKNFLSAAEVFGALAGGTGDNVADWQRLFTVLSGIGEISPTRALVAELCLSYERWLAKLDGHAASEAVSVELRLLQLGGYYDLAFLAGRSEATDRAESALQRALFVARSLADEGREDVRVRKMLFEAYAAQSELAGLAIGEPERIARYCRDGITLWEEQAEAEPQNRDIRRELCSFHECLGNVAYETGQLREASASYMDELFIRKELAESASPEDDDLASLAECYGRLAGFSLFQGRYEEARQFGIAKLRILEQQTKESPEDTDRQFALSTAYDALGSLAEHGGNRQEARGYYEKALRIDRRLVETAPDRARSLRFLAASHSKLGRLAAADGQLEDARSNFLEALKARKSVVEQEPDEVGDRRAVSETYEKIAELAGIEGEFEQVLDFYLKALSIRRELAAGGSGGALALFELFNAYDRLGYYSDLVGRRPEAFLHFLQGLVVARTLLESYPETTSGPRAMASSFYNLGLIDEQLDVLRDIQSKNPKDDTVVADLLEDHFLTGSYAETMRLVSKALELIGDDTGTELIVSCYGLISDAMLGNHNAAARAARRLAKKARGFEGALAWNFIGARLALQNLRHSLGDSVRQLVDAMEQCSWRHKQCQLAEALETFAAVLERRDGEHEDTHGSAQ